MSLEPIPIWALYVFGVVGVWAAVAMVFWAAALDRCEGVAREVACLRTRLHALEAWAEDCGEDPPDDPDDGEPVEDGGAVVVAFPRRVA